MKTISKQKTSLALVNSHVCKHMTIANDKVLLEC